MTTNTRLITAGLASIVVALFAGVASAGSVSTIDIISDPASSIRQLGSYTGSISYDTDGILNISLTNTSTQPQGGFITSFAFNTPDHVVARLTSTTSSAPFRPMIHSRMHPFGRFDYGATLRGRNNRWGIAQGTTESFQFAIHSPQAPTLRAIDFMSDFSTRTHRPAMFLTHFKGFGKCASDKVPAVVIPAVPTPTAALAGIVLLSGLALRRRRMHT